MEIEFQKNWDILANKINKRFDDTLDVESVLFVIGMQELGQVIDKFTKDQKLEVIHVAVCVILEPFGFYEFEGRDKDAWPHWKVVKELPRLDNNQQEQLIKEGILEYMKDSPFLA
ncbi:MAG: hypothetical protein ACI91R_000273 [Vicingaceae bacterium]|jgi:hypothetical protein